MMTNLQVHMASMLAACFVTASAAAQSINERKTQNCDFLMTRYIRPAQEFMKKFPTVAPASNSFVKSAATAASAGCDNKTRPAIIKTLVQSVNFQSQKIGVILPMTGGLANYGKNILDGVNAALRAKQVNPEAVLVVRDNASDSSLDERLFAELVLKQNIALVIGGFQSAAAATIEAWSEKLAIPALLLSMNATKSGKPHYSIRVFPYPDSLMNSLVEEAKAKGLRRIAILSPTNSAGNLMASAASDRFTASGLQIVQQETYSAGDYASMEAASKKLFKVLASQREEEYRQLVIAQRARAQRENTAFNIKMVVLRPQIDFDAIFIPDNFKQVRHLVQIFKYLGVKQIPLMGHYEWRSEGLLKPAEPFLVGSFFADFVGSYQDIPPALAPPKTSGFFAKPDELESLDFRIIGWRAGDLSTSALAAAQKRNQIPTVLQTLEDNNKPYFGSGKALENNRSRWPASIFTVSEQQLILRRSSTIGNSAKTASP